MKSRATLLMVLTAICCINGGIAQAAEDIVFRTSVTPEEPWVGQQVLLSVDVLAKDGWAQLKKIGEFEIEGAYVLRLETQGIRLNEVVEGDSYTGQRYEFMIFAQRDGKLSIPPTPVDVEVKTWGAGGGDQVQRLSLPAIEFAARTPPGAEGIRGLISTTNLTASQNWDPEIDSAEVGDAIERTITLHADDVSGMAFAPMQHGEIENLGIYSGEPTVDDKFARGDLSGSRVESVTYVFEQPGEFEIPGVKFSWWDVRNSELRQISLPGLSVQIAAGAVAADEAENVSEISKLSAKLVWSVLFTVAILAVITMHFGRRVLDRFANWRRAQRESEANYFKQVMRAIRSGDQNMVLRETMRWLDRINQDSSPARLDQFLEQYGDEQMQTVATNLVSTKSEPADRSKLKTYAGGLAAARRRWQKASRVRQDVDSVLPALNGRS